MKALRRIVLRPTVRGLVLGLLVFSSSPAWSQLTIPHTFVTGTPALASEVNNNFSTTATAVNGKVNKAGDTMTGTLTAPDFAYSTPMAGQVIAVPNSCIRAASFGSQTPVYFEMGSATPPGNVFGPSVYSISTLANLVFDYFCPIPLQVPPGAAVTITGATLAYFDSGVNCRTQAEVRHKTFGASDAGTIVSTVHDGADATDFAFVSGGPATKAFPAFTLAVPLNRVVWINATIAFNAIGGGDCRYSGVLVDYTVSKP